MVTNIPTSPPWDLPFTPLPRNKIVVIANSSVNWSLSECQYYCRQRGIPLSNIISFPMTNDGTPYGTPQVWLGCGRATFNSTVTQPLRTHLQDIKAVGILIGPGCPAAVEYESAIGAGAPIDIRGGLANLLAATLRFDDADLLNYYVGGASGNYVLLLFRLAVTWSQTRDFFGQFPGRTVASPVLQDPNYQYQWNIPSLPARFWGSFDISSPTQLTTALFAAGHWYNISDAQWVALSGTYANNRVPMLPVGRIGFESYGGGFAGGPPMAETQAKVRQIIDAATASMGAHVWAEAIKKPMLFHLTSADLGIGTKEGWAYLYSLAKSWGINASYAYFDPATAGSAPYAPDSGSLYNEAAVQANSVRQSAYLIVGGWQNYNPAPATIYGSPYKDSWVPYAGASMMQGPSDGFQYTENFINAGAIAGMTDETHITTANLITHFQIWYNLLRGMSWFDAAAYTNWFGCIPCGDPLWAPYALSPDPGPQNDSASLYTGRDNLDQRSGFKVKRSLLKKEWTGILTENPEPRHPLDLIAPKEPERGRGSQSPEPADSFKAAEVKPSDL